MVISEMEGSQRKRDVQDRRLSLIDFSSADDSLIDPGSGNLIDKQDSENKEHVELLDTPNSRKFEDATSKLEEWEQEPRPTETFEIGKAKKNGKCNLRKSLAWDSAFFTSAGVLDPEELSSIIEGVEKDEKHALPEILEDVHKSCESISTLESDSLTLESLEADLFEDIRASIQKSSKKSDVANGSSKVPSGVVRFQTGDSLKKIGMASGSKMKASPALKNPSASMQVSGKMTKKNPIYPQVLQKLGATRGESSIVKQPKVHGKSSPSLTTSEKRASLGAKRVIGGRVSSVSKAPTLGGSRGVLSKTTFSSKSSSGPSVANKTKSSTSTSFGGNLSDKIVKSPFNSLKRKVDAGTIKPPSSGTAVRTPSKTASRNKSESRNSSLSGLMSVTKLSSSISPASSISDWSSESSSSTSMTKYRSNSSRTSLDSSSCRKALSDTDASQVSSSLNPPSDSSLEGQESQLIGSVSQCARSTSAGTVLPPAAMKPSGLRLPSPKIGFFDGMKSSVRTPRGGMQSHSVVPRGLPKHGRSVCPTEGQNKTKLGKLQPARSIMSNKNTKPNNQQTSLPIPLYESSDVAVKTSSVLQNVESSSEVPMEVVNKMLLESTAGKLSNMTESLLNGTHDLNLGSTQNIGILDTSMETIKSVIKGNIYSMDIKATTDEERNNSDSSSTYNVGNSSSSEIVGEGSLHGNSNLLKAEGPALESHDIGMHNSDTCSVENKEVLDISMDKMIPEGNNGMHSQNNIADHNPGVSNATEIGENTSPSYVVEKVPVCKLDLINDLHPIKGANDLKTHHYDDQIDCLSNQLGVVDINSETQKKFNGHSLSFSQSDVSSQDNPNGVELSSRKELLDCPKQNESPSLYIPAYTRRPFAVKDSFCNINGLFSVSTESKVAEIKANNVSLPESMVKENN